jgi:hypothetical protein
LKKVMTMEIKDGDDGEDTMMIGDRRCVKDMVKRERVNSCFILVVIALSIILVCLECILVFMMHRF